MRRSIVFILGLVLATSVVFAAEKPASLHPVAGDVQEIVLLLDTRPYLIRLHVQIGGRSFRGNWEESIAHLFRYLDQDGDGALSAKEVALAPSKTQWVQLMGGTVVEPDAAPEFAELTGSAPPFSPPETGGKKGGVTLPQLSLYYRSSGAGALQVEWGWRQPGQDQLGDELFQR